MSDLPQITSTLPPRKRAKTQEEKEQRRIERILRNRRAAHASREKKRKHVEFLENSVNNLQININKFKLKESKLIELTNLLLTKINDKDLNNIDLSVLSEAPIPDLELNQCFDNNSKDDLTRSVSPIPESINDDNNDINDPSSKIENIIKPVEINKDLIKQDDDNVESEEIESPIPNSPLLLSNNNNNSPFKNNLIKNDQFTNSFTGGESLLFQSSGSLDITSEYSASSSFNEEISHDSPIDSNDNDNNSLNNDNFNPIFLPSFNPKNDESINNFDEIVSNRVHNPAAVLFIEDFY